MRLSESLRRGIMESFTGGIINKFKIKQRRDTLFFEDILANYIKACEIAGYKKEMWAIGESWTELAINALIPESVKKLPIPLFSQVMKRVWMNLGTLEDFNIKRINNNVILTAKKDSITRIIGKNRVVEGSYAGILKAYLNCGLIPLKISQSMEESEYIYKIENESQEIKGRDKKEYNALNTIPYAKGFTLKDAIKSKTFQLKENRLYFRGKSICNSENTLFHIIGNRKILLEKVPEISYRYFNELVEKDAADKRKLHLLRTLLQLMGWGIIKIIVKNNNAIIISICCPPYGLQSEKDNWDFLIYTILGYLWIIDRGFKIKEKEIRKKQIIIEFSCEGNH